MLIWPRSLHLGWLTSSALIHLNAYVRPIGWGLGSFLFALLLSAIFATVVATFHQHRMLSSAVAAIAWALFTVGKEIPVGADDARVGVDALAGLSLTEELIAVLIGSTVLYATLVDRVADPPSLPPPSQPPRQSIRQSHPPAALPTAQPAVPAITPAVVRVGVGVVAQRADGRILNDVMPVDGKHYITIFMLVRVPEGQEPQNLEPHKCAGWQWILWDELEALPQDRLFIPIVSLLGLGYRPQKQYRNSCCFCCCGGCSCCS